LDDILFKIAFTIMQYTGFVPREIIDIDFNKKKDSIVMTLINKKRTIICLKRFRIRKY